MSSTTLTMVAVIMTATFMVTAFVWQPPPLQQAHAFMVFESSSPSCVDNQPCHTSVTNSSTPHTSSPYSASSSKLAPSPASILAPHSFLPNSSSSHPPSHHTSSPYSASSSPSLSLAPPPSPKLKHHNLDSSTSTTNYTPSLNSTGSLSNDLSHLFDDIR